MIQLLTPTTFAEKVFDYTQGGEWKYKGAKPAIIDFYADWCGPCHMLAAVLERVAERYKDKIDFYKVDTEASPELAALFGIRGLPSLLFVSMNEEPALNAGFIPEEAFERAIQELLGVNPP